MERSPKELLLQFGTFQEKETQDLSFSCEGIEEPALTWLHQQLLEGTLCLGKGWEWIHGWLEHRGLSPEVKQPGAFGNTWICFQADFSTSDPAKPEEGQLHHLLRAHICSRHREGLTPAKSSWFPSYCSGFLPQELESAAQRLCMWHCHPWGTPQ